jgi:hypothetical protein
VAGAPVFVLGITPRSGTNHLWDVLALHPAFDIPRPIWEDAVVANAHHLEAYVDGMHAFFSTHPNWNVHETVREELWPSLGVGLVSWLEGHVAPGRRILTKMPSVRNVALLPRLFPTAHLILLVRDGRAVTESCVRTFGWSYERAMRHWAAAGREIMAFEAWARDNAYDRFVRVRYEDLMADERNVISTLLEFVDANPSEFDFDVIDQLPIRGSSLVRDDVGGMTWRPIEKPAEVDTIDRTAHWDRQQRDRFDWLAGDVMDAFGYERCSDRPSGIAQQARDARWMAETTGRDVWRRVVRRVRRARARR